ncbi:MAG: phosphoenolpyruvate--protein phosphotransferase [Geminicoccaceae bacterium]
MSERRYAGTGASPGLASGPALRLDYPQASESDAIGTPLEEKARLDRAMTAAAAALRELSASQSDLAGDILEFQLEMLDDPALIEDVLGAIADGTSAAEAWSDALGAQIEGFRAADDGYFQARAHDLDDLCQRVLDQLHGRTQAAAAAAAGAIVLARDLTPSRFLEIERHAPSGIALEEGSTVSHVAMLARARGVPMIVGCGPLGRASSALMDGTTGQLTTDPTSDTRQSFELALAAQHRDDDRARGLLAKPAHTKVGERVWTLLNVDTPDALDEAMLAASDGIGLWRTEFLFLERADLPSEEEQYATYTALLERAAGKPVIVRTLDIGGDKPLPALSLPRESNPFLGLRGLRLSLDKPELFRPQLNALLRAAARFDSVKIMLPMVTRPAEIAETRALIDSCLSELAEEGTPARLPPVGMMVETPASALGLARFPVDFVSIGSNDLTQYVMAASRDARGRVGALADPLDPAVLNLIAQVAQQARRQHIDVSVCGDMAADPSGARALLDRGLRHLSVGQAALARLKLTVADYGA